MKKRIIGILLTVIMIVGILPLAAIPVIAEDHGLIVTRGGEPAKQGTDYQWIKYTGNQYYRLYIYKDGLTISGSAADNEFVIVNDGVSDLTIENVNISCTDSWAIDFATKSCKLILKGDNTVFGSIFGIEFSGGGEIAGEGNLTANGGTTGIRASSKLVVSASGTIYAKGGLFGINGTGGIEISDDVSKIVLFGSREDVGSGISWGSSYITLGSGLKVKGSSSTIEEEESNINNGVTAGEGRYNVGRYSSKNIIIQHADLTVTKGDKAAEWGTDYDWSENDANKLIIKSEGLTVSGTTEKECIYVSNDVSELTIENLSAALTGNKIIEFANTNNDCKLIVKGNNTITTDRKNYGIYFTNNGEITGDGNLKITNTLCDIISEGKLIISASGTIIAKSVVLGIYGKSGLEFTDTVGKVIAGGQENGYGAIKLGGDGMKVAPELMIRGTTKYEAEESEIDEYVSYKVEDMYVEVINPRVTTIYPSARTILVLSHKEHIYTDGIYIDNGDGTHSRQCFCDYVDKSELGTAEHDYSELFRDNGDGTHSPACVCGLFVDTVAFKHKFVNGVCACGAVKPIINEYFIINGKDGVGSMQWNDEIVYDASVNNTIYVEEGKRSSVLLRPSELRAWKYSTSAGENAFIACYYKPVSMGSYIAYNCYLMGKSYDSYMLGDYAEACIFSGAAAGDSITVSNIVFQQGSSYGWKYETEVSSTVVILSREDIIKKSITSRTYPLYISVGSGFDSLDSDGTLYIASDYEIFNKTQEHSECASGYIDPSIVESEDFVINENGDIQGIFDPTGEKVKEFISGIDFNGIFDKIVAYNSDSANSASYIYADDGKIVTNSNKNNYEIIPVVVKIHNSADAAVNGWYINLALKKKPVVSYDLNAPDGCGFSYKPMGATNYTLRTTLPDSANYDDVLSNGLGKLSNYKSGDTYEIAAGDKVYIRYSGNLNQQIIFLGWNTEKDGSGEMYAPGDKPEFDKNTTLYAIWGETYVVHYYQDSYIASRPAENRIYTSTVVGIIGSQIVLKQGTGAGELNFALSKVGDDYDDGMQKSTATVGVGGSATVAVLYTKPDHVHTAGSTYMYDGNAHWFVCGTENCGLVTVEDYLNAFAESTSGRLKDKLGYGEHTDDDHDCVCDICEGAIEHQWTIDEHNHKCDNCLLEGKHIDSDKNDICDICGAKGVAYYCPTCDGRGILGGTVECEKCWGMGEINITCPMCDDYDVITCPECNGSAPNCDYCGGGCTEECPKCDGDGTVECPKCDGSGSMNCPDCDGYGCDKCGDIGVVGCNRCGSSGVITCGICNGATEIECTHCNGTGEGICEKCNNSGYITCPECNGEGSFDIKCPECNGEGYIDLGEEMVCPDCHGSEYHTHFWESVNEKTHKCPCGEVGNHFDEDMDEYCDVCGEILGYEFVVVSLGAKINTKTHSLRLGAFYNGYILEKEEREAVKDLGTIFYPSKLLGESALDLDNTDAVRISAVAIEEFDVEKVFADYETFTFYVTIVGIPENGWNTKIAFRPYIILGDGTTEYGDVMERCYNDVVAVKLK